MAKNVHKLEIVKSEPASSAAVIDVLSDALDMARNKKVTAVGVVFSCEDRYHSDFAGRLDELAAGTAILSYRVQRKWDDD